MTNSLNERIKTDQEHYRIVQLVNAVYHTMLRDYIANANEREVLENLYNFFTDSDLTLITKQQLKVYQELEKLTLNASELNTNG